MIQFVKTRLRIGVLGCRGIPNHYGGYEQFAQHLSVGLVEKGHEVIVYNSSLHPYTQEYWNGVQIIHQFDAEDKLGTFGQFVYDFNCLQDVKKRNFDVLLQLGYTSNAIFYSLWPKDTLNVVHMDGLEWKRTKYSKLVQMFLKKMEGLAANKGDILIADSKIIQEYLYQNYRKESVFIPYGTKKTIIPNENDLDTFGLKSSQYLLAIARFVPENNLTTILEGYLKSRSDLPLVLVGNCKTSYGQYLQRRFSSDKIKWLGGVYDQNLLDSLRFYCRLYFHGHSVGGTNPSLLEAMVCQALICAHENNFNKSVLGQNAFYFKNDEQVANCINQTKKEQYNRTWKINNTKKILAQYQWEQIINQYEDLFLRAIAETK